MYYRKLLGGTENPSVLCTYNKVSKPTTDQAACGTTDCSADGLYSFRIA